MKFFENLFEKSRKNKKLPDQALVKIYDGQSMKDKVVIFLIPNKIYQVELLHIIKGIANKFSRILYLSLNKPAESIIESLKEIDIDTERFLFVDAVNKDVQPDITYHNTVLINSPENFEKFNIELNQIIEKEKFECFIFDSLSTMLIYQGENAIIKFIHDLITKLRIANVIIEFTSLAEDTKSALIKDVSMFADKIIEMSKEKSETENKDFKKEEMIFKLKNELQAVEQAYASKLISDESYSSTVERIKAKLRKLGK